jgi:hypothetical protein
VFARSIREDPERRGLLYAGTEAGIYVSFDDGAHWESLRLNLPVVPVHDLVVKGSDLVVATHGRSFWILDDITPLRQLTDGIRQAVAHLFEPRPATRFATGWGFGSAPIPGLTNYQHTGAWISAAREVTKPDGEKEQRLLDAGQNPHEGVYITYLLKEKPEGEVTLTLVDASGNGIRTFSSEERKVPISLTGDTRIATGETKRETTEPKLPKEAGLNRFYWDTRYPEARPVNGFVSRSGAVAGPAAAPGTYEAQLTVGGQTYSGRFQVRVDPRVGTPQADLQAQFDLQLRIRDAISEVHDAVNTIHNLRAQVEEWERRASGLERHEEVAQAGAALRERLSGIEEELIQTKAMEDDDTLRWPVKLNLKLAALYDTVGSADTGPTRQAREVFDELAGQVQTQVGRLRELIEADVAAFDRLVRDAGVPVIAADATLPKAPPAQSFAG